MGNFSFKMFGYISFMNEMRVILKPELLYLYSKLLEVCALFGCSHISGYIKLSLGICSDQRKNLDEGDQFSLQELKFAVVKQNKSYLGYDWKRRPLIFCFTNPETFPI